MTRTGHLEIRFWMPSYERVGGVLPTQALHQEYSPLVFTKTTPQSSIHGPANELIERENKLQTKLG